MEFSFSSENKKEVLEEFGLYKDVASIVIDYVEAMDFEKQLIDIISDMCDCYSLDLCHVLDMWHKSLRVYSDAHNPEIDELRQLVLSDKKIEKRKLENTKVKFWRKIQRREKLKKLEKEIQSLNSTSLSPVITITGIYRDTGRSFNHIYANTTRLVKSAIPEEVIDYASSFANKKLREYKRRNPHIHFQKKISFGV